MSLCEDFKDPSEIEKSDDVGQVKVSEDDFPLEDVPSGTPALPVQRIGLAAAASAFAEALAPAIFRHRHRPPPDEGSLHTHLLPRRSEGRLKRCDSVEDPRAWSISSAARRDHLKELVSCSVGPCSGNRLIPLPALFDALLADKNAEIDTLRRRLGDHGDTGGRRAKSVSCLCPHHAKVPSSSVLPPIKTSGDSRDIEDIVAAREAEVAAREQLLLAALRRLDEVAAAADGRDPRRSASEERFRESARLKARRAEELRHGARAPPSPSARAAAAPAAAPKIPPTPPSTPIVTGLSTLKSPSSCSATKSAPSAALRTLKTASSCSATKSAPSAALRTIKTPSSCSATKSAPQIQGAIPAIVSQAPSDSVGAAGSIAVSTSQKEVEVTTLPQAVTSHLPVPSISAKSSCRSLQKSKAEGSAVEKSNASVMPGASPAPSCSPSASRTSGPSHQPSDSTHPLRGGAASAGEFEGSAIIADDENCPPCPDSGSATDTCHCFSHSSEGLDGVDAEASKQRTVAPLSAPAVLGVADNVTVGVVLTNENYFADADALVAAAERRLSEAAERVARASADEVDERRREAAEVYRTVAFDMLEAARLAVNLDSSLSPLSSAPTSAAPYAPSSGPRSAPPRNSHDFEQPLHLSGASTAHNEVVNRRASGESGPAPTTYPSLPLSLPETTVMAFTVEYDMPACCRMTPPPCCRPTPSPRPPPRDDSCVCGPPLHPCDLVCRTVPANAYGAQVPARTGQTTPNFMTGAVSPQSPRANIPPPTTAPGQTAPAAPAAGPGGAAMGSGAGSGLAEAEALAQLAQAQRELMQAQRELEAARQCIQQLQNALGMNPPGRVTVTCSSDVAPCDITKQDELQKEKLLTLAPGQSPTSAFPESAPLLPESGYAGSTGPTTTAPQLHTQDSTLEQHISRSECHSAPHSLKPSPIVSSDPLSAAQPPGTGAIFSDARSAASANALATSPSQSAVAVTSVAQIPTEIDGKQLAAKGSTLQVEVAAITSSASSGQFQYSSTSEESVCSLSAPCTEPGEPCTAQLAPNALCPIKSGTSANREPATSPQRQRSPAPHPFIPTARTKHPSVAPIIELSLGKKVCSTSYTIMASLQQYEPRLGFATAATAPPLQPSDHSTGGAGLPSPASPHPSSTGISAPTQVPGNETATTRPPVSPLPPCLALTSTQPPPRDSSSPGPSGPFQRSPRSPCPARTSSQPPPRDSSSPGPSVPFQRSPLPPCPARTSTQPPPRDSSSPGPSAPFQRSPRSPCHARASQRPLPALSSSPVHSPRSSSVPSARSSDSPRPTCSPRASPRHSPGPASPIRSPRASPTHSPHPSPAGSLHASPAGSPHASPSGSPRASPTCSPRPSPAGTPHASPAGSLRASPAGSLRASPAGTPHASPADSLRASPAGSPHASPADSLRASPAGSPHASPTLSPRPSPSARPLDFPAPSCSSRTSPRHSPHPPSSPTHSLRASPAHSPRASPVPSAPSLGSSRPPCSAPLSPLPSAQPLGSAHLSPVASAQPAGSAHLSPLPSAQPLGSPQPSCSAHLSPLPSAQPLGSPQPSHSAPASTLPSAHSRVSSRPCSARITPLPSTQPLGSAHLSPMPSVKPLGSAQRSCSALASPLPSTQPLGSAHRSCSALASPLPSAQPLGSAQPSAQPLGSAQPSAQPLGSAQPSAHSVCSPRPPGSAPTSLLPSPRLTPCSSRSQRTAPQAASTEKTKSCSSLQKMAEQQPCRDDCYVSGPPPCTVCPEFMARERARQAGVTPGSASETALDSEDLTAWAEARLRLTDDLPQRLKALRERALECDALCARIAELEAAAATPRPPVRALSPTPSKKSCHEMSPKSSKTSFRAVSPTPAKSSSRALSPSPSQELPRTLSPMPSKGSCGALLPTSSKGGVTSPIPSQTQGKGALQPSTSASGQILSATPSCPTMAPQASLRVVEPVKKESYNASVCSQRSGTAPTTVTDTPQPVHAQKTDQSCQSERTAASDASCQSASPGGTPLQPYVNVATDDVEDDSTALLARLQLEAAELAEDRDAQAQRAEALESERADLHCRVAELTADISRLEGLEEEVDALRAENEDMSRRLDEANTTEAALLDMVDRLAEAEEAAAEVVDLRQRVVELESELEEARALLDEANAGGDSPERHVLEEERDSLLRLKCELECAVADQEDEIRRLTAALDRVAAAASGRQIHRPPNEDGSNFGVTEHRLCGGGIDDDSGSTSASASSTTNTGLTTNCQRVGLTSVASRVHDSVGDSGNVESSTTSANAESNTRDEVNRLRSQLKAARAEVEVLRGEVAEVPALQMLAKELRARLDAAAKQMERLADAQESATLGDQERSRLLDMIRVEQQRADTLQTQLTTLEADRARMDALLQQTIQLKGRLKMADEEHERAEALQAQLDALRQETSAKIQESVGKETTRQDAATSPLPSSDSGTHRQLHPPKVYTLQSIPEPSIPVLTSQSRKESEEATAISQDSVALLHSRVVELQQLLFDTTKERDDLRRMTEPNAIPQPHAGASLTGSGTSSVRCLCPSCPACTSASVCALHTCGAASSAVTDSEDYLRVLLSEATRAARSQLARATAASDTRETMERRRRLRALLEEHERCMAAERARADSPTHDRDRNREADREHDRPLGFRKNQDPELTPFHLDASDSARLRLAPLPAPFSRDAASRPDDDSSSIFSQKLTHPPPPEPYEPPPVLELPNPVRIASTTSAHQSVPRAPGLPGDDPQRPVSGETRPTSSGMGCMLPGRAHTLHSAGRPPSPREGVAAALALRSEVERALETLRGADVLPPEDQCLAITATVARRTEVFVAALSGSPAALQREDLEKTLFRMTEERDSLAAALAVVEEERDSLLLQKEADRRRLARQAQAHAEQVSLLLRRAADPAAAGIPLLALPAPAAEELNRLQCEMDELIREAEALRRAARRRTDTTPPAVEMLQKEVDEVRSENDTLRSAVPRRSDFTVDLSPQPVTKQRSSPASETSMEQYEKSDAEKHITILREERDALATKLRERDVQIQSLLLQKESDARRLQMIESYHADERWRRALMDKGLLSRSSPTDDNIHAMFEFTETDVFRMLREHPTLRRVFEGYALQGSDIGLCGDGTKSVDSTAKAFTQSLLDLQDVISALRHDNAFLEKRVEAGLEGISLPAPLPSHPLAQQPSPPPLLLCQPSAAAAASRVVDAAAALVASTSEEQQATAVESGQLQPLAENQVLRGGGDDMAALYRERERLETALQRVYDELRRVHHEKQLSEAEFESLLIANQDLLREIAFLRELLAADVGQETDDEHDQKQL